MFKTLYSKLALVLTGLFCIVGIAFAIVTIFSTDMYQQEVNQQLNSNLAQYIVDERNLIEDGRVNEDALKELFHMLMVINPSVEIYLLDNGGKILAFSAPPGKVKRKKIGLAPILKWINSDKTQIILGEDPRNPDGKKVFTAAPVFDGNAPFGYLYVILGGEEFDGIAAKIKKSFILRISMWIMLGSLLFALVTGLILFAMLTGRLKNLARIMDSFKKGEKIDLADKTKAIENKPSDEIDRLTNSFRTMAEHINYQMERLQKSDSLRRELVANVSHDLRTPLATLRGYMETLLLKEDNLTEAEQKEYLKIAIRHCVRLNELVNELFELAKLDSEEIKLKPEPFNINELVYDIVQKFRLKAKEKDVLISINMEKESTIIDADIALIERALENLIENAIHYTNKAGTVTIALSEEKGTVKISVNNTGKAIPPEELPFLFDRFFQSTKRVKDGQGHSGLGLAITKKIVELHNSVIDVTSDLDTGTTFRFGLPLKNTA